MGVMVPPSARVRSWRDYRAGDVHWTELLHDVSVNGWKVNQITTKGHRIQNSVVSIPVGGRPFKCLCPLSQTLSMTVGSLELQIGAIHCCVSFISEYLSSPLSCEIYITNMLPKACPAWE